MKVAQLIEDFSGLPAAESEAQKQRAAAEKLTSAGHEISPGGIKKWQERGTIPAPWIVRILQTSQPKLDLANYI